MSSEIKAFAILFFVGISVLVLTFWAWPNYRVWQQGRQGEAELRRAEQNKQVLIEEAKAKAESAGLLAEAQIARAKGVAEANKIIGDSLEGKESYLRYLWIMGLQDGSSEVIYVPTEAGLPILEAGKKGVEIEMP